MALSNLHLLGFTAVYQIGHKRCSLMLLWNQFYNTWSTPRELSGSFYYSVFSQIIVNVLNKADIVVHADDLTIYQL